NVLGMAQRGGVVSVQLRLDRTRVSSPMIMTGKAMLGGFTEPLEALRWQHMLAVGASVVIQDKRVVPPSAGQAYPQDPIADLRNLRPDLHIQVSPVAVSPAPLESAYLLGMLSNHLPLNETQWHGGLQRTVAEKYWLNTWHAFQKGRDFLHEGCRITQRA
ncbi:MAG: 2-oxoacid:acceptor oxidoreductase family protein, partial [Gammaproteobacteria bacterium]